MPTFAALTALGRETVGSASGVTWTVCAMSLTVGLGNDSKRMQNKMPRTSSTLDKVGCKMKYIGGQEEYMNCVTLSNQLRIFFDIALISSTADKGQYAVDRIVDSFIPFTAVRGKQSD